MAARFKANIAQWVQQVLDNPKNLATENELHEQARAALNLFITSDVDKSNSLSFDELKILCDTAGLPMESSEEEALVKMDTDDNGTLDIEEWVLWWLKRVSTLPNPLKQQEAIARNTFRKFDKDASGCMDSSELGDLTASLGAEFTDEELLEALAEIDEDNSGLVDESEFVLWWTNRASNNRKNSSMIALKMKKLAAKAAQIYATDIFTATWNGDLELVKGFLQAEKRLANATDATEYGDGWSPLHYACFQGHQQLVQILLDARANVNAPTNLGFTPLFYAAQRGHLDICQMLMNAGADPTLYGVQEIFLREDEEGEKKKPAAIFMCPLEHCIDYPELKAMFKAHEKCIPPLTPDPARVIALVTTAGVLKLGFQGMQRDISHLPVKYWDVLLVVTNVDPSMDGGIDIEGLTLNMEVPAVPPNKHAQDLAEIALDKEWLNKLHFLGALFRMKSVQLIEASDAGLQDLWKEISNCYHGIADPSLKKIVTSELEDIVFRAIGTYADPKGVELLTEQLQRKIVEVRMKQSSNKKVSVRSTDAAAQKAAVPKDISIVLDEAITLLVESKPAIIPLTDPERKGPRIEVAKPHNYPKVSMELSAVNSLAKGKDCDSVDVAVSFPSARQSVRQQDAKTLNNQR